MAGSPHLSVQFGDLLDPRFNRVFNDRLAQLPDMVGTVFDFPPDNGRADFRYSEVGAYDDWEQFTGSVTYDRAFQGYDVTGTHVEFARGVQVERKLFDDDQYGIMDARPRGLATAYNRTRQSHAARIFNNMAAVDSMFYTHSEGVALVSNSHTTNATGVSTATGFDNLITTAFSSTALVSARNQMVGFRGDRGERISIVPDEIWFSPNLYDKVFEVIASPGKPGIATNDANVHEGAYTPHEWNYIDDNNDWMLADSSMRGENLKWVDRVGVEFAFAEDIDTLIAKWRGYARYSFLYIDWRWILGAVVS